MATESNRGVDFHHHRAQAMSFQSSAASEFGNYYYGVNSNVNVTNSGGAVVFSGASPVVISSSSNSSCGVHQPGSSFGSLLVDTVPGLKHEAGLAVEWSVEEQFKLEEALVKYACEPNIMKYIKIAAVLRDKTVRDVALRCRWMTRKRRKKEDHNLLKKVKDRRDRIESCLKPNVASHSTMNVAAYSIPLQAHDQSVAASSGNQQSGLIGTTRHLLEENNQALGRISSNLITFKLQENVDLFLRTRSNLTTILQDMRNMPGIMSQMPPLPVYLNEELVSYIFPISSQGPIFGSPTRLHLKQEPGC